MDCNCILYLTETANRYITSDNKLSYKIYICANCKKYFIKRFFFIHEVEFNHETQNWNETKQIKKLEI